MNTGTLELDILDDVVTDEDFDFDFDSDAAFEAPEANAKAAEKVVEAPEAKVETPKPAKAKKATKAKAKAAPKAKAPKPAVVEVAETAEPVEVGKYKGQNDFGHIQSLGKSSSMAIWNSLLTEGVASVSFASELSVLKKAETEAAETAERAKLLTVAVNRISQRLQQPYQKWYPEAKAKGVFAFERVGNGAAEKLVITYSDNSRPPLLVSEAGRVTKVGRLAMALDDSGAKLHCGITKAALKAARKAAESVED